MELFYDRPRHLFLLVVLLGHGEDDLLGEAPGQGLELPLFLGEAEVYGHNLLLGGLPGVGPRAHSLTQSKILPTPLQPRPHATIEGR